MRKRNTKKRELILRPDGCYDVPLSQGLFAVIDAEDAELVGQHNWFATLKRGGYFHANTNIHTPQGKRVLGMHGLIIYGPELQGHSRLVDHQNHDTLDNRRHNLRPASPRQNAANRRASGACSFLGVAWHRRTSKYQVQIRSESGRNTYIGVFTDPVEGARAYDAAARERHGEFANLNFPEDYA